MLRHIVNRNVFRVKEIREALNKSARAVSERFFGQSRHRKRRNTLCTRKGYAASVSRLTSATAALYFPFSIPKSGRKRSAHGRRRFVQRFPGRQTKAVSFHRGNSPRIWRNSGFQIDGAVEEVFHILAGAFREKRNHHGGQQTGGEAGNDLVDIGGG